MKALHRGNEIKRILDCKRDILQLDIYNADNRLSKIKSYLDENKRSLDKLSCTINELNPTGLMTRSEIYQIIRKQGVLLTERQHLIQKICQLEQDKDLEMNTISQCRIEISSLEKKQHKITQHFKPAWYKYVQNRINNEDSETQEIVTYGSKNI